MPPKTYKEPRNYATEMQDLVGVACPVSVVLSRNGELVSASYEAEWKEGTTKPVDTGKKNPDGSPIFDYEDDYKKRSLTKKQVKQLEDYIKENVKSD